MTFRWPSPCLHHQQQWEGEVVKAMALVTHPLQVTGAPLKSSPFKIPIDPFVIPIDPIIILTEQFCPVCTEV